ncbi:MULTISPECIES: mechanosensitive ion channel family protein [Flavobacterium]|uniref:Mechanosensitive ion channel n=2 Tax=Flavobacterium TaxID=237 RepID=A0AA94JQ18_9FLAO|nr:MULTISPECIES: mechanosensitive ion channel domain-containing protein [Flavobacterium]OXA83035.1 mechanosensitive ion channel protein [Flavobacterium columnare NBRC 100251 = ATCC 23463]AMA50182.1 mechanosensitive ion channel protein [Flavobacterium covae]AND64298.1 mechanosensitive ion channel protein [Flavobacterium covae]MCH4829397.1 mechanosensitive ion channel [Flavobacterium columnare]MCH4834173.1 mechanosensitive ion channel [Flavobacterium columnare]
MINIDTLETAKEYIITYSINILTAGLIFIVGIWLSKFITKTTKKILISRNIEITLVEFLEDLIYWTIRGLVFIAVISKLGVETSSFVAILGAAGLAVGLSLQGSLSNFSGGILIILFKPFKVGDKIEVQGEIGKVEDIHIFSTKLTTGNNQVVYIPNGMLSNGKIKNHSQKNTSRNDFTFTFPIDQNIKISRSKLETLVQNHPLILKDPKPEIFIANIELESFSLLTRVWTQNSDGVAVKSDLLNSLYDSL